MGPQGFHLDTQNQHLLTKLALFFPLGGSYIGLIFLLTAFGLALGMAAWL